MLGNRRVWLEIDLGQLRTNFENIKYAVQPAGIIAVLKANAYGLGASRLAAALAAAGVDGFGVAELGEALEIIHLGKPVQILGGILEDDIPEAIRNGVIIPVTDLEIARAVSAEAARQGRTAECHFLVDTGMGRLGILESCAEEVIEAAAGLPNLDCSGIYSHFPVAYREGEDFTEKQAERLFEIVGNLAKKGINFRQIHIANSDAINNFPFTYHVPFTHVRTGINLHGSFDSEGHRTLNLKSILNLKSKLVAVRTLSAGTTLGYGRTYKLRRDTRVGTVAAGYADGLPHALSNRGYLLVGGVFCPIIGRVSMDYTTISLENAPDAKRGDDVVCLGGQGIEAITVDSWAQLKGTHPYDIICSFGSRVERRYIESARETPRGI